MQKGLFNNMAPLLQILLVVAIAVISMFVFTIIGFLILIPFYGVNEVMSAFTFGNTEIIRFLQITQSFALFVVPAVIAAYLFSTKPLHFLGFEKPNNTLIILSLILFFVCLPMISFLTHFNDSMVFPEFLKSLEYKMRVTENRTNELIFNLLDTKQPFVISVNLFMIVILPAFGEELFFRGTLQPLLCKLLKNNHIAVWLTAFIFAAIHLQFFSFLPRFVLGVMLGYLLLYGKNIWYPIAGHFLNNFISLVVFYYYRYTQPDIDPFNSPADEFGTLMIVGSFICVGVCFYIFHRLIKYREDILIAH